MRAPLGGVALPLSFRQLLLVAFLCIALLLSGALVRALMAIQTLAEQNRIGSLRHVSLVEDIQQLDAQTVSLERIARQYMVLDDPVWRERYTQAWSAAQADVARLHADLPAGLQPLLAEWSGVAQSISSMVTQAQNARVISDARLLDGFRQLGALHARLVVAGKQYIDQQNLALLTEIEAQRVELTGLAAGAMGLALVLALSFGLLLSRPLQRVEKAIARLGEHRLDEPVVISGPVDIRRLGHQLDWLRLRLLELEDTKARFLRHISHELKTPLAALREGVSLLEDETAGELTDNQREVAGILRENTIALQEQIEGLLRFNASIFQAQQLHYRPVDLRDLIALAMRRQRLQWQARRLNVSISGEVPSLKADAEKLEVVVGNLLSNAIRFSPEGGAIHFALEAAPGGVRIDCLDEGPGVAPEDVERIFEPFRQGARQPVGARHGSGIGLSIVREFIAAHGGTVRLMPSRAGAHFRIELPVRA